MTWGVRILVIDDSRADAYVLRATLDRSSYFRIEWAHDLTSDGGLASIETGEFDLVFLDYLLDQMDGLEVLRRMKAKGIDVPIVLLTGMPTDAVRSEAIRLGACHCLEKDGLTTAMLETVVVNALGHTIES